MTAMVRRIAVRGPSGSGKTTVSATVAGRLDLPHVELDALHHGPNWTETPLEDFRRLVDEATASGGWVADGNYDSKLGDLVLRRAEVVIWLDPPLVTLLARLWRRTSERIRNDTELWAGNRESWRSVLWGRESLFVWALRTRRRLRRELPKLCADAGVPLLRLRSDEDVDRWLTSLGGDA